MDIVRATSRPNIALIKYWGNRDNVLRLPAADSLSMTLDRPSVEVTVSQSDAPSVRSFAEDSSERTLEERDSARLTKHQALCRQYLETLGLRDALPATLAVEIRSHVPPRIGIASSAAVFSCLAEAFAGIVKQRGGSILSREDVSILARLGSGSAARSVYGGFSGLFNRESTHPIASAAALQIAPEDHWPLHDIIVVPSREEKKVGSTEGHAMAQTSPLFAERIRAIPRRIAQCIDAIRTKDFEKLRAVSEEDCLDMHAVMQSQDPPLHYLNDETHRIIRDIEELRRTEHLEVLYTMDAGPTVHLFCTDDALRSVLAYADSQKQHSSIFQTEVGPGSHPLP